MIQYLKEERLKECPDFNKRKNKYKFLDPYDRVDAFYETDDDWYPEYQYNGKKYVMLVIVFWEKEKEMKLLFRGGDDFGLEKVYSYKDIPVALQDLEQIDKLSTINHEDLALLEFYPM